MAKVVLNETVDMDKMLAKLPIEVRGKELMKGMKKAAGVVARKARTLAPKGDPNHHPDKEPLHKTIIVKSVQYQNGVHVAIVGPSWPDGAHGHLVEEGHEIKVSRGERKGQAPLSGATRSEVKEFLAPAADTTHVQQEKAVIDSIQKAIVKAGG